MDNQDLKYIKKHYGENFAKLCRELFPPILETPGLLSRIITEKFDNAPTLYEDILSVKNEFKNYVYSFVDVENNNKQIVQKSPEELLDEAGYVLYPECQTEEDIQKFKRYYKSGEELCTFRGGRLNSCRVWFAVKKNFEQIKRENFQNPTRQDEYGTSVISIQFTKGRNSTLSIKNRYNHTVNNPDNTFNSNLDNIISGLTNAFCEKYNINLINKNNERFLPDGYVLGADGRLYKSNMEIDGFNYCANNVVVRDNGKVIHFDKSKYILIDYFLMHLEDKQIRTIDFSFINDNLGKNVKDSFVESIGKIKSINLTLDENKNKVIDITPEVGENVQIVANKLNQIIKYSNPNVKEIGPYFLYYNKNLTSLNLPNVTQIGDDFLRYNENLAELNLPNMTQIGDDFLRYNENLTSLNLPKVEEIRSNFLRYNENLTALNLPRVEKIGYGFLYSNKNLTSLNLPKVEEIGDSFLCNNQNLESLNLPRVEKIDNDFLRYNKNLTSLNSPKVKEIRSNFLRYNENLTALNLPRVKKIGDNFLCNNENLTALNLPKVEEIGNDFLCANQNLIELNLPNVKEIGHDFLFENQNLIKLNLLNVKEIEYGFLYSNKNLTELNLPNVKEIRNGFLYSNKNLTELNLPNVKEIGHDFLYSNKNLTELNLPKVEEIGTHFLFSNKNFKKQNFLKLKKDNKDLLL